MKVGIIGCGGMARAHGEILRKNICDCVLVFCDRNPAKADALAKAFSDRPAYDNAENMLVEEKPDVVHVLTQLPSHADLARAALEAGAHVYIEKPVTSKVAEFNELSSLAKNHKKHLCAGYSTLGMPVVQKAKSLITSGDFGRLITVHCDFNWSASGNSIPYGSPNHWAYSLEGGILQNIIDHPMSLVVDAMVDIKGHETLFCKRKSLPGNCADVIHVGLKNDDQVGSLSVSFGHGNTHAQAHFCLEAATIVVDLRRQLIGCSAGKGSESFVAKTLSGIKMGWVLGRGSFGNVAKRVAGSWQQHPGIAGLIRNFYATIDGRQNLIVSESTASQTIAILERIWKGMGAER